MSSDESLPDAPAEGNPLVVAVELIFIFQIAGVWISVSQPHCALCNIACTMHIPVPAVVARCCSKVGLGS